MPRNLEKVRVRLQAAAMELFRSRGYDTVTAAEIARRAGVTERTFFRHFADKREALFGGEAALLLVLTNAVRDAPEALGMWATLFRAFQSAESLLIENRHFAQTRRHIIAGNPPLQEREAGKATILAAGLAEALGRRGHSNRQTILAAHVGTAAFAQAFELWLQDESKPYNQCLEDAFQEVKALTTSKLVE